MRNLVIAIVTAIALALFGYQVYEVGYRDGAVDIATYGNTYAVTAVAYGVDQLLTPDGNIWNCGLEVLPDTTYMVVFADNNTADITDDIIVDFWTV